MTQYNFENKVKESITGFRHLITKTYKEDEIALVALIMDESLEIKDYKKLNNTQIILEEDLVSYNRHIDFLKEINVALLNIRAVYKEKTKKYTQPQAYGRGFRLVYKIFPLYTRLKNPNKLYAWEWEMLEDFLNKVKQIIL